MGGAEAPPDPVPLYVCTCQTRVLQLAKKLRVRPHVSSFRNRSNEHCCWT